MGRRDAGNERMIPIEARTISVQGFTPGSTHSFGGKFLELEPRERICYTDQFDDPNLPGELRVRVTFKQVSVGTEVDTVQALEQSNDIC